MAVLAIVLSSTSHVTTSSCRTLYRKYYSFTLSLQWTNIWWWSQQYWYTVYISSFKVGFKSASANDIKQQTIPQQFLSFKVSEMHMVDQTVENMLKNLFVNNFNEIGYSSDVTLLSWAVYSWVRVFSSQTCYWVIDEQCLGVNQGSISGYNYSW